uniref:Uncharacterized protein n=1 Tax=Panagrolaimus sp. JU765 TaxID=591449 RepID=A0AC34RQR5_9BILA
MFLTPLLALAVASKATCPPSGIAAVGQCFTPFFAAYNYSLFPDFSSFDLKVSDIIQDQGVNGMESFCKNQNALVSCLGNNAACVSGVVLMKNYSVNYNDAYGYAGFYSESTYNCGPGNATDRCLDQAIGDFGNGKICKGYNDMTYCYSTVYINACGAGISPLVCNMLQKDFQPQDGAGNCTWFDCSKPFPYNGTSF